MDAIFQPMKKSDTYQIKLFNHNLSMKTTLTCFKVASSSNRNVAVVPINSQSENLRKLHEEMI